MDAVDDLIDEMRQACEARWLREPEEIARIRLGVNQLGAGSHEQYFSLLVHLETYVLMLGQHQLYDLLSLAEDDDFDLPRLVTVASQSLAKVFDCFEFLDDLGLHELAGFGHRYLSAIKQLKTVAEFTALTSSLFSYTTITHRWIHFIFPWHLGVAFPKPSDADFDVLEQARKYLPNGSPIGS